jgi:V/A-type H+/Na+-transporting ATPase subunit E
MENLDTGKDKIKKICEVLKNETLQPAKEEAQNIIEAAQQEARNIVRAAHNEADEIVSSGKIKLNKEKELFDNSIRQACSQTLESLRQEIENHLFNKGLSDWLKGQSADPTLVAKLINVIVQAIEKEGTSAKLSALIPEQISAEKVNALLIKDVLEKLREHSVVLGKFAGGVQIKLHDKHLTLDLSNESLKELIGQYIRKDFRDLLFQTPGKG